MSFAIEIILDFLIEWVFLLPIRLWHLARGKVFLREQLYLTHYLIVLVFWLGLFLVFKYTGLGA